jgi:hypothetical protein
MMLAVRNGCNEHLQMLCAEGRRAVASNHSFADRDVIIDAADICDNDTDGLKSIPRTPGLVAQLHHELNGKYVRISLASEPACREEGVASRVTSPPRRRLQPKPRASSVRAPRHIDILHR